MLGMIGLKEFYSGLVPSVEVGQTGYWGFQAVSNTFKVIIAQ
jgi:hypothetical protein